MNTDPAIFLMANLGSEVTRLLHALHERNDELIRGAYQRTCDILKETQIVSGVEAGQKELALLQNVLDDLVRSAPELRIRPESVRQYFMPFALRALSEHHIF